MKGSVFSILCLVTLSGTAFAQKCPDVTPYQKAREVIADLGDIVSPEGVQETYKTKIGGIDQWVTIRGQDRANPIVLFIHGGPASPLTPTLWQFQRPLEEYFTMATYDQRGAGKTFLETDPATIADTIHIERYVDDAIEIAEHLLAALARPCARDIRAPCPAKHQKQKLILMGHSWGSIVGMHVALKRPDLFYAYVGIGQAINVRDNERISYEFGLEQAKRHNNTEAVKELEAIAPYPGEGLITRDRIIAARKWAQHYGGLSAYRETSRYFFRASLLAPEYSAADVCAIDSGNLFTLDRIMPEFQAVDFKPVRSFPIPVVMLMGRHDYTTPQQPTADWLAKVSAPSKQGIWFEHSSHMVPWEEPGKTLVTLLEQVRPLAMGQKK